MQGKWVAAVVVGLIAVFALIGLLLWGLRSFDRTPNDPRADAELYLERAYGTPFRFVASARDSKPQDGFPNQWEVTFARLDAEGADAGKPFRLTINYDDGVAVRGGGSSWDSEYCLGEVAAFQKAAAAVLDRPVSEVRLLPRVDFPDHQALAGYTRFSEDTERAFEVELVVFATAEAAGDDVTKFLATWSPRWSTARKVTFSVAFSPGRRDKVKKSYQATGSGWTRNREVLWTIELDRTALTSGAALTPATITALVQAERPPASDADPDADAQSK